MRAPSLPHGRRLRRLRRLSERIWDAELTTLPWFRRRAFEIARVVHLVLRGFLRDECALRASALTYYTLMALVPVLVLALALARVFGGEVLARTSLQRSLERWASQVQHAGTVETADALAFQALVERLRMALDRVFDQIAEIQFATLGGVGLVVLIWTAVEMLTQVESSLNRIWGVPGRAVWRRFADYLSVLLIVPFLALAASTLPVAEWVSRNFGQVSATRFGGLLALVGMREILTALLLTLLFGFLAMFVPNTRVRLVPAIVGGLTTALLFMGWLRLCAALQVGVVRYGKLYGGFAAVPIMLAWTYVSWEIILLGSEVTFAVQNVRTYSLEEGARRASPRARLTLALGVTTAIARTMASAGPAFDAGAFANGRRIAVRLMNEVMEDLAAAGVVVEIAGAPGCFVLARDPAHLTVRTVLSAMLDRGESGERLGLRQLDDRIRAWVHAFEGSASPALDKPLSELV